jgi:hypothetical protein
MRKFWKCLLVMAVQSVNAPELCAKKMAEVISFMCVYYMRKIEGRLFFYFPSQSNPRVLESGRSERSESQ